jgi:hypothetical protein
MRSSHLIKIFSIYVFWVAQSYAIDEIRLDERTSLFQAIDKTVPIVTAKFIGWGENWVWAGAKIKPDEGSGKNGSFGY